MMKECANCSTQLPENARFCPGCSQKVTDGRIRMRDLLLNFWNNNFHLEGKFIKTSWELLIPGRVTKAFFEGKQQRYLGPLRMFAITMFLFLLVLNHAFKKMNEGQGNINFNVKTDQNIGKESNNVSAEDFFLIGHQWIGAKTIREHYDSLPPQLNTPEARLAYDSALNLASDKLKFNLLGGLRNDDTASVRLGFSSTQVNMSDVFKYSPEQLIERYQVNGWLERMAVKQGIKLFRDSKALIKAYLGSITTAILLTIVVLAGVFYAAYRRPRRYYVEHFIFLLHFNTGLILLLLPFVWLSIYFDWMSGIIMLVLLSGWIGLWWAMKRFYAESNLKTTLKWLFFSIMYLAISTFWGIAIMILIFFIF
jgi:Protein of unknown function (DUF3667)